MYRCATMLGLAAAVGSFALLCPTYADDVKTSNDAKFVREAASGGMMEVQLGKLAADHAVNPDVRKFGERMVADHTKVNKELKNVADKAGMKLPAEMSKKDQEAYDKLKGLKGADFDRMYMTSMVKDHEEDIAAFTKESKDGSNADVKAFATRTLPTLKEHLKLAKDVNAKIEKGK